MNDAVRRRQVVIKNEQGLHMRPAMLFMQLAGQFESQVTVIFQNTRANGRSITELMMLAAACGTELTIEAQGRDADEAVERLAALVEQGFPEQPAAQPQNENQ